MKIKLKNGCWLEKDGTGNYYYYNKDICNRVSRDTQFFPKAIDTMVKNAMDKLDFDTLKKG